MFESFPVLSQKGRAVECVLLLLLIFDFCFSKEKTGGKVKGRCGCSVGAWWPVAATGNVLKGRSSASRMASIGSTLWIETQYSLYAFGFYKLGRDGVKPSRGRPDTKRQAWSGLISTNHES